MGKLYFNYGCMNSLKSGTLLTKARQFADSGCEVILLKPDFDSRDKGVISSRAITTPQSCYVFGQDQDVFQLVYSIMGQMMNEKKSITGNVVVFVDEISFATKEHIKQLWRLTRCPYDVSVFTYGLKTTYMNTLFEPVEELMVLADKVEEIKSRCSTKGCGKKATAHLRRIGDVYTFNGEERIIGDVKGEEKYESVCQTCWHETYDKENR